MTDREYSELDAMRERTIAVCERVAVIIFAVAIVSVFVR